MYVNVFTHTHLIFKFSFSAYNDADADAVTPSSNTRSYTLWSIPSSPRRSFLEGSLVLQAKHLREDGLLPWPEVFIQHLEAVIQTVKMSNTFLTLGWKSRTSQIRGKHIQPCSQPNQVVPRVLPVLINRSGWLKNVPLFNILIINI